MRDEKGRWVKGSVSPRKGAIVSEASREKMSLARLGKVPWNKGMGVKKIPSGVDTTFKKGMTPWNKGLKGYNAGENNPSWKGGITEKNRIDRNRFKKTMQKLILERDNYTCQMCNAKGKELQVDHIQSWSEYVELRFSMDNCRTLCVDCHYLITFGKTKPQHVKTWGRNKKQIERRVV